MSDIDALKLNSYVVPQTYDVVTEESNTMFASEKAVQSAEVLSPEHGNIAYEILLLQQRLTAYEQLHIEEMAELRQEIERLRRVFLQETNPRMRIVSPSSNVHVQE